jgi:hypothetical protein
MDTNKRFFNGINALSHTVACRYFMNRIANIKVTTPGSLPELVLGVKDSDVESIDLWTQGQHDILLFWIETQEKYALNDKETYRISTEILKEDHKEMKVNPEDHPDPFSWFNSLVPKLGEQLGSSPPPIILYPHRKKFPEEFLWIYNVCGGKKGMETINSETLWAIEMKRKVTSCVTKIQEKYH